MINADTILILGAGASVDCDYPIGINLNKRIFEFLHQNTAGFRPDFKRVVENQLSNAKLIANLANLIEKVNINEDFVRQFAKDLNRAQPPSIDDFLYRRPEYSLVGKICIYFCLSSKEGKNYLDFSPTHKEGSWSYKEFWYQYLWRKLISSCNDYLSFKRNKIKVITFNYDLSLEHYLSEAISAYWKEDEKSIRQYLDELIIGHVYGDLNNRNFKEREALGSLFDVRDFSNPGIMFCFFADDNGHYGMKKEHFVDGDIRVTNAQRGLLLQELSARVCGIKTYREALSEDIRSKYREYISKAKKIYFLGFGFHQQNMEALGLKEPVVGNEAYVFATMYEHTRQEMDNRRIQLQKLLMSAGNANRETHVICTNSFYNGNSEPIIQQFFRQQTNADLE